MPEHDMKSRLELVRRRKYTCPTTTRMKKDIQGKSMRIRVKTMDLDLPSLQDKVVSCYQE